VDEVIGGLGSKATFKRKAAVSLVPRGLSPKYPESRQLPLFVPCLMVVGVVKNDAGALPIGLSAPVTANAQMIELAFHAAKPPQISRRL
jgi:hypothetical protein